MIHSYSHVYNYTKNPFQNQQKLVKNIESSEKIVRNIELGTVFMLLVGKSRLHFFQYASTQNLMIESFTYMYSAFTEDN